MKKIIKNPLIIFALGLIIVSASGVGATRAAMKYSDANEKVSFETEKLYVDLQEDQGNGYVSVATTKTDSNNEEKTGKLSLITVSNAITAEDTLKIDKEYSEKVQIQNTSTGNYDEYVRVMVRKSWIKSDGTKDTRLDPSLIVLHITDNWIEDLSEETEEGSVYYCKLPIAVDETVQFLDSISFDRDILNGVTVASVTGENNIVQNIYGYDGKTFEIEIRVDAVQTHNGVEAILGAWGADATLDSNNNIVSINGSN